MVAIPLTADDAIAPLGRQRVTLVRFVDKDGIAATWPHIARRLQTDPMFSVEWAAAWRRDFDYQWKPVPVHPATRDRPFFAVLVPARFPAADSSAFSQHLDAMGPSENVASFPSLRGDSTMVVPARRGAYASLGEYTRSASASEQRDFWGEVGRLVERSIDLDRATWCNTHGHAVPWLHVRFDPTHKYPAFPPHGAITAASQSVWHERYYEPVFGVGSERAEP